MPSKEDITHASKRLKKHIPQTPVFQSAALNEIAGAKLYFKMENLMPDVGCFKVRGALNALLSMHERNSYPKMILTQSSGNHAQAVAWAAKKLETKATIVMPRTSNETKKRNVREMGGIILECEPGDAAREQMMADTAKSMPHAAIIHPFNDYAVIAGQATAAKELLQQVPQLNTIIAPVGGGGLLSGTALAAYHFSPMVEVIGAEPAGANDAYRSMQSGKIEENQTVNTIADGLITKIGANTFPIIRKHVDEIIEVDDEEIKAAMRMLWDRLRAIIEPSGAVAFAAALQKKRYGKHIGIILSGGNVDLDHIPFLSE